MNLPIQVLTVVLAFALLASGTVSVSHKYPGINSGRQGQSSVLGCALVHSIRACSLGKSVIGIRLRCASKPGLLHTPTSLASCTASYLHRLDRGPPRQGRWTRRSTRKSTRKSKLREESPTITLPLLITPSSTVLPCSLCR